MSEEKAPSNIAISTSDDSDSQKTHSTRLTAWGALAGFSVVSLGALLSLLNSRSDHDWGFEDKLAVSVTAISFGISVLAIFSACYLKDKFMGTKIEGAGACLVLLDWIFGIVGIMDPDNHLAENPQGINANLYYFSWLSLIASLFVVGHFAQEKSGGAVDVGKTPPKIALWLLFSASSFVVMGASIKTHLERNCSGSHTDFCKSNKFAISVGALGGFIGVAILLMARRGMIPRMLEMVGGLTVLILYGVGVAVITFGDGSGTQVGNLYYFTWLSLGAILLLALAYFKTHHMPFWGFLLRLRAQRARAQGDDNV